MSQDSVEKILGRLLTDAEFRAKVERQLEKTCRDMGFQPD